MRTRVKSLVIAVTVLAVFAASAGMTGAYLARSTEKLNNVITRGSIEVKVTEPEWVEANGRKLTPGSVIAKDPTVVNTGKNEAWIFLKVQIPMKEIVLVDAKTKKKQEPAKAELFSFSSTENWKLVKKSAEGEWVNYVFGYRFPLEAGKKTDPLFREVTLVNYLEGELDDSEVLTLPIEAMAIQTNVCADGADLQEIFEEYLKGGDA